MNKGGGQERIVSQKFREAKKQSNGNNTRTTATLIK